MGLFLNNIIHSSNNKNVRWPDYYYKFYKILYPVHYIYI